MSKIINELNGKLNDLHTSVGHSDKVSLEKFKALEMQVT